MKEDQDLVEMLRNHELAIKRLYETFAGIFPKYQEMWDGLIQDEQKHALWIEKLRTYPDVERWMLQNIQVKHQSIKLSIGYIETQGKTAIEGRLKLIEALSFARDLENALIEKQFSRLNNSGSEKINSIMAALSAETDKHRKKITEAIDIEKRLGA